MPVYMMSRLLWQLVQHFVPHGTGSTCTVPSLSMVFALTLP